MWCDGLKYAFTAAQIPAWNTSHTALFFCFSFFLLPCDNTLSQHGKIVFPFYLFAEFYFVLFLYCAVLSLSLSLPIIFLVCFLRIIYLAALGSAAECGSKMSKET